MKALYYVGDKAMELRDVPMPQPAPGTYLVKVRSNGICGSDFEGYLGKTGRRLPPMIMGHEVSGVVETAPEGGKVRLVDFFAKEPIVLAEFVSECFLVEE